MVNTTFNEESDLSTATTTERIPVQVSAEIQARSTINNIPTLTEMNKFAEQIIASAKHDPALRYIIKDILEHHREELVTNLRTQTCKQIAEVKDVDILNGPLSLNAIQKSWQDAGMTALETKISIDFIWIIHTRRHEELALPPINRDFDEDI